MRNYTSNYVDTVFMVWYTRGKPAPTYLYDLVSADPTTNTKPTQATLKVWITDLFAEKAAELDKEVNRQIQERVIAEKVEMLERHATMGAEMQDMAIRYLRAHESELTVNTSVRLLVEGVEIERNSRGLPDALKGLSSKSDDELLKEIEKLVSSSPVTLLPNTNDDDVIPAEFEEE